MKKIAESGFQVYFCSAPIVQSPYCASEKYAWIKKHFGRKWERKLILAPDKTMVHGDYLIDDRDKINGGHQPTWEHLLFDQPSNREVEDKRRISWDNWREVLSTKNI